MKNAFNKLTNEIDFKPSQSFKETVLTDAKLKDNIFHLNFSNDAIIPMDEMEVFLNKLNSNFKYKTKISFKITAPIFREIEILNYFKIIFKKILVNDYAYAELENINMTCKDNFCTITTHDSLIFKIFNENKSKMVKVMRMFGFHNFDFGIKIDNLDNNYINDEKFKLLKEAQSVLTKSDDGEEKQEINIKAQNSYKKMNINELSEGFNKKVIVEGVIFKNDVKQTKTSLQIFTLSIADSTDAIYIKIFAKTNEEISLYSSFKEGQYIEVSGDFQIDTYSHQPSIIARKIRITDNKKIIRKDNATYKRVELSTKTRMSTMDGVSSASQLVKRAEEWGHQAITILDKDSAQSFPDLFYATKNSEVKPIYGVSFSTLEKNSRAIYWPNKKETNLLEDSYVVFDLETTGLSPEYEDIIEFGATKIINGSIVENKQFFVKPTKPIPKIITEITSITDEDVADAKQEKDAIKDIRDYLEGHTLVAHNANFDITFVNAKLIKYGLEPLYLPTIDSLIVARMTHPKSKRFRLETTASRYDIHYDSTVAHRADYDADVLARVWLKMMNDLLSLDISTQKNLYEYSSKNLYEKAFSKEVSIIAIDQKGLKELFLYLSKGLTESFAKGPKIFIEDIKHSENIMVGSGSLNSRLVEKMIYGSKTQVKEEISRYDYIEVQPTRNFAHLINRGFDIKNLEDMISFVVEEAKKQNKIIVASGDVRYLDEQDKIFHDIYINAKGLGGKRHSLFKFNEINPVYPTQNFLTTKEMKESFSFLGDINLIEEIVVKNPIAIAEKVKYIEVIKKDLFTPKFKNADSMLTDLVYKNAENQYGKPLPEIIEKRIVRELNPIKKYGFSVIYWISHLLVSKSLKDGYLVGSRGSVGSSFVATMSEITEVNPLEPHYVCSICKASIFSDKYKEFNSGYDLEDKNCSTCDIPLLKEGQNIPFETFLGFEANKVPDIDLNFSGDYQPIIHNEVKKLFGEKGAFRAGTISTVAEKTAFGYVKSWAEDKGKEISKAYTEYLSKGVAGTKRTTGQHPGGIIVIPEEFDVEDFTPINYPANDETSAWKTTHFDFHAIHDNVLKLDLLGHDDPTAIKFLEKLTGINAKKDIPFSDSRIISLFSSTKELGITPEEIGGETTGAMGIPEFGTTFVRRMLKNASVKSFGDLISLSGLSHGTDVWTNNAETLIKKNGLSLNEVISCRDDIMTDLINKKLDPFAAFNIMEKVRKGKGLTSDEEKLLRDNKVDEWYIDSLQKIKYMFPKAHATAYVMMAWRIAWFKLYHPLAYYAAYFTTRSDVFDISTIIGGKDKINIKLSDFKSRKNSWGDNKLSNKEKDLIPIFELALEAIARGYNFENIDLIKSDADEWKIDKETKSLIPPFSSVDGLGDAAAKSIVEARKDGDFISMEDLVKRTSVNKTLITKFKDLGIISDLHETNQIQLDLFNI